MSKSNVTTNHFSRTITPSFFRDMRGLRAELKVVLVYLNLYTNAHQEYGHAWPTQAEMAVDMGISRESLNRSVATLQEVGYVSVEKQQAPSGQIETYYIITIPIAEIESLDEEFEFTESSSSSSSLEGSAASKLGEQLSPKKRTTKPKKKLSPKEQLFEQFVALAPVGFAAYGAKKSFMKLDLIEIGEVLTILPKFAAQYTRAKETTYAGQADSWITKKKYLDPKSWNLGKAHSPSGTSGCDLSQVKRDVL